VIGPDVDMHQYMQRLKACWLSSIAKRSCTMTFVLHCIATAYGSNKLYNFDFTASSWSLLSPSGTLPSGRVQAGFAATPAGALYVFGGMDANFGG
jgi:hypothetical protein